MGEICKSKQLFCIDHNSFFTIIYIFQLLASSPYGVHQLGREIHRDQVISKLLIKSSFVQVTCEIKIRKMYQISIRIIKSVKHSPTCLEDGFGSNFNPKKGLTTGFWGKEAWNPPPKWNTSFSFAFSKRTPGPLMISNLRVIRRFHKVKFFMTLFLFAINR